MLRGSKGGHSCRGQVRVPGSLSLEEGTPKFSPQALLPHSSFGCSALHHQTVSLLFLGISHTGVRRMQRFFSGILD